MITPINERVPTLSRGNPARDFATPALVPVHVKELLNVRRLPARLTARQTAALLNCGEHDIPVLVATGLLRPLGHPPTNGVKYYCPVEVLELAGDRERMGRICDAVYEYWRVKNAGKPKQARRRTKGALESPARTERLVSP